MFQQFTAIKRFHQEGNRAISQCLLANLMIIMGSDDDDRQLTSFPSNPALKLGAVDAGQPNVGDDAHHTRERTGQEKCFRRCETDGLVPGGFENALNRLPNPTIVINSRDDARGLTHQAAPFSMHGMVRRRASGWLL